LGIELEKKLEAMYQVFPWDASENIEKAYQALRNILAHSSMEKLLRERKEGVRVLDICGGIGVAGIALSRLLLERGYSVKLYVNDLRRSALEKARTLSRKLLGLEPILLDVDAKTLYKKGVKADIALLWGHSAPHFDAYEFVQLAASTASILGDNGVFLLEEVDRAYTVFYRNAYRDIAVEYAGEDRVSLSLHSGYDPIRGVFYRVYMDLDSGKKVRMPLRLWDLASLLAILWVFFSKVDFTPIRSRYDGIIVASEPRRLNPEDYNLTTRNHG